MGGPISLSGKRKCMLLSCNLDREDLILAGMGKKLRFRETIGEESSIETTSTIQDGESNLFYSLGSTVALKHAN